MVIEAREGSEVKAIADGRVLLADWLQGYVWPGGGNRAQEKRHEPVWLL